MHENEEWRSLTRSLFTGAPMTAAAPETPAPAQAPAAAEAPAAATDPFREWVNDTDQQQAKATAVERIAAAHNVPASVLVGNTPEELTEHAEAISAMMHHTGAPVVPGGEKMPNMNPGMDTDTRAMLNLVSAPHLRS